MPSFKSVLVATILPLILISSIAHAEEKEQQWQTIPQDNLLYLEFETGVVTIQLADFFAPDHVGYIRNLVNEGFYDGLSLYRVIENFVVQGGDLSEQKASKVKTKMKAEFERSIDKSASYSLVQKKDIFAEQTGFINGFAVGRSLSENKEWLIHCPGVINLARGIDINSGTTDFAIMFGVSPRHLDRNMSVFGRIIDGWEAFYAVKRGPAESGGVFENTDEASKIIKAYLGSSLPKQQQETIMVEDTGTEHFREKVAQRRLMANDFFHYKGNGNLDVCYLKPQVKKD